MKSPGAPDTVRWCTGQSGAPDQGTLRLSLALFVEPNSWSFYWLSVNLWHLYNLYTGAKLVSPIICVGQFNHQNKLGTRCKPNSLSLLSPSNHFSRKTTLPSRPRAISSETSALGSLRQSEQQSCSNQNCFDIVLYPRASSHTKVHAYCKSFLHLALDLDFSQPRRRSPF
jgi:hypothetical protein